MGKEDKKAKASKKRGKEKKSKPASVKTKSVSTPDTGTVSSIETESAVTPGTEILSPTGTEPLSTSGTPVDTKPTGGSAPLGGGGETPSDCSSYTSWLSNRFFQKGIYTVNLSTDGGKAVLSTVGFDQIQANRLIPDTIRGPFVPNPELPVGEETPPRDITFGDDCEKHIEFASSCDPGFYIVEIMTPEQLQWLIDEGFRPEVNTLIPGMLKGPLGDDPYQPPT